MLLLVESEVGLQSNNAFSLGVAVHYHLLYLGWAHLLPQLLSCRQQVLLADIPLPVLVEVLENALDVFISIALVGLLSHHFDEFSECDFTAVVGIEATHSHIDERPAGFVASVIADGLSEVHGSEHTVVIIIEMVEHLFEYFDVPD